MEKPLRKSVLFVDDEPRILEGLSRMLRGIRNEWDMTFAPGSIEALDIMREKHFDVIVSDMRMPEMDGAQLLSKVKELYPHMVRIILSGHSDKKMVMKTVKPAHQYLSKPCNADLIKSTLSRISDLDNLTVQGNLKDIVLQIDALPSLPSVYIEIMDMLKSPGISTQQIGRIIAKDMGMTTTILHLVNSAFFGIPCHISDTSHAISLLGIDTIKALVLITGIFSQFPEKKILSEEIKQIWDHSMKTAVMAKEVASMEGLCRKDIDDVFTGGLLHDIGKLILATNLPEKYEETLKEATVQHIPLQEAEFKLLGTTHAEIGAYLMALWNLSDNIVEAIANHHHPEKSTRKEFYQLGIIHVVNHLEHETKQSSTKITTYSEVNLEYLDQIGWSEKIQKWKYLCNQIEQGGTDDTGKDPCSG